MISRTEAIDIATRYAEKELMNSAELEIISMFDSASIFAEKLSKDWIERNWGKQDLFPRQHEYWILICETSMFPDSYSERLSMELFAEARILLVKKVPLEILADEYVLVDGSEIDWDEWEEAESRAAEVIHFAKEEALRKLRNDYSFQVRHIFEHASELEDFSTQALLRDNCYTILANVDENADDIRDRVISICKDSGDVLDDTIEYLSMNFS